VPSTTLLGTFSNSYSLRTSLNCSASDSDSPNSEKSVEVNDWEVWLTKAIDAKERGMVIGFCTARREKTIFGFS
jgi:hypothetical protein